MRLTQLTEGPCDVAKPEEIEKMSGTEYDKYAQWKKDCEADERTTPLSTKRMSEKAKPDFLDLDKDGDKKEPMKSAGKQKKEVCEEPQVESYSDDYDLDSNWEDDYHGDMSQEEYDQEVDNSQMEYAVWVGGTEVNDKWLTYDEAITLYDKYKAQGYDDIKLDARIKEGSKEVTEILKPGSVPGAPKTRGSKLSPHRDLKKPLIHTPITTRKSGYAESVTDEEQLDEILPVLAVGAAAAAVGTAAYKGGKAIGNWLAKKKTPTADAMPGDGMASDAAKGLEDRKKQMSKNLAALKSESAFSKKVKEAADEDAEAVSARDDFVNMMSTKPNTTGKAIDTIKQIVADSQNMQVKFDDGKMKVDLYTASAVSQVYDAVKPETQAKMDTLLRTKAGMLKISNFAFSSLKEDIQRIEEAREEGRLDEWLPLAIGAARLLAPVIARQFAQKGGAKAVQNIIKKGIHIPGSKKKIAGKVLNKIPGGKKGAAALAAVDMEADGNIVKNVSDLPGRIKDTVWKTAKPFTPLATPSSNNSNNGNGATKFIKRNIYDSKDEMINEIQPEYVGADAIVDQNGKKHNPNSPKAKMIINMRKKNSGNKDSEEMTPKEIKAAKIAQLKAQHRGEQKRDNTARSVKKGFKKGMKSLGGLVGGTGFINPLAASKYSPEDKAMEMVEKAMDQALLEDK